MGMDGLRRDPSAAARERYDLIVIGGGVYGAMTALEAARRGLRPLLLERDDFGGATSWNSHRIVHGGLRYLQRLDLARFFTSVRERRWYLLHFPDLVEPLPCLMPLYGQGVRRAPVMRLALALNHLLSRHRNEGVRSDRRLESGGVLTPEETLALFPAARERRLRGGALWYDAVMRDTQRVLMETLRWACARGARCLNYTEATALETDAKRVRGVRALDRVGGTTLDFAADTVINCAGPWSAQLASALGDRVEGLFRPSLAFNLLFEREAPSEVAVAVSAPEPGAPTWFLYPRGRLLCAGTAHFPYAAETKGPAAKNDDATERSEYGAGAAGSPAPRAAGRRPGPSPTKEQIDAVIVQINAAVPGLELRRHQVLRVHAGLLPVTRAGGVELTDRPVIHDHGAAGGPAGLFSVSGVKYTTARDVAEAALRRAFASLPPIAEDAERPPAAALPALALDARGALPQASAAQLRRFAAQEAVVYAEDLLLRRGRWADDPRRLASIERPVGEALVSRAG